MLAGPRVFLWRCYSLVTGFYCRVCVLAVTTHNSSCALRTLTISQAQRLALRAQGFGQSRADSTTPITNTRSIMRCVDQMSVLQIDAINTVIRSHYMPVYSRIGHYARDALSARVFLPAQQRLSKRRYFEYWGHECSIMPLSLYPLFRWRRRDAANGVGVYKQISSLNRRKPEFVDAIRSQITRYGPATHRTLALDSRGSGMWEWSESKQALEYLFWSGEITTVGRQGFERLYDFADNSIPAAYLEQDIDRADAQAQLMLLSVKSLGIGTASDLRDYFRLPASDADKAIARLLAGGDIEAVVVKGWKHTAYTLPEVSLPRSSNATALLTPFDPMVWHRERTERLFGFSYRIEIYVPAAKRQYGYYVLPFMLNGKLVARLDIKADRESGALLVKGAWAEAEARVDDISEPLSAELQRLAHWLELGRLDVSRKGDLAKRLRRG